MSTQTTKPFAVVKAQEIDNFISVTEQSIANSRKYIKEQQDFIVKATADVDRARAALLALRGKKTSTTPKPKSTVKKRRTTAAKKRSTPKPESKKTATKKTAAKKTAAKAAAAS